ncbi:MAG: MBG domain-containing protein, partial [Kiritimatiellia bacterium]
ISSVTLTSPGAPATATTGSYAIAATDAVGTGLANYSISYISGSLEVTPRDLTLVANDTNKTYGTAVLFNGSEFSALGLVNTNLDAVTNVTLTSAGAVASAPTGTYAIAISDAQGTRLDNYSITYSNGTLTVGAKTLTITASSTNKVYGDAISFSGTEFTADGLEAGDSVTNITLTSPGAPATAATGSYAIVASAAQGVGIDNYAITYVDGSLVVTPRALTITAGDASKTYGTELALGSTNFTANTLVNADEVSSVSLTSLGAAANAATGTYTIAASNASGVGLANYAITYLDGTLTVGAKALTITADNQVKTYGDSLVFAGDEFSAPGLESFDAITNISLSSLGAVATASTGTYAIVVTNATGPGLANYAISYVDGSLAVTPRALTITANSTNKTFGETLIFVGTEFTASGLTNSDVIASVELSSAGAIASALPGNYAIVVTNATGDGLDNYEIAFSNGVLSVLQPISVILSDNGMQIGRGGVLTGAVNHILLTFRLQVTASNRLDALHMVTAGDYALDDLLNFKLWRSADSMFGDDDLLRGIYRPMPAGTNKFTTISEVLAPGTHYFFITTDVSSLAVTGRTIRVLGLAASDVEMKESDVVSGSTSTGGLQTIQGPAPVGAPTVITATPSSITSTSANLGGVLLSEGYSTVTNRGIIISTSPNPDFSDAVYVISSTRREYRITVTNLQPDTVYYVSAYAQNGEHIMISLDLTFRTLPLASPVIQTLVMQPGPVILLEWDSGSAGIYHVDSATAWNPSNSAFNWQSYLETNVTSEGTHSVILPVPVTGESLRIYRLRVEP